MNIAPIATIPEAHPPAMSRTLLPHAPWTLAYGLAAIVTGLCCCNVWSQEPVAPVVALVGGTVHTVCGEDLPGGAVLLLEGKIAAVGLDLALPPEAQRIDVTGCHVYPGLIDAYTQLGLVEIDAVRATRDTAESGQINPNVRAQEAFHPDSELIPVARAGGVLTVLTAPEGGLISGTSAVMRLDGWSWEEMTVHPAAGLHVQWPAMAIAPPAPGAAPAPGSAAADALEPLRLAFADARAYAQARQTARQEGRLVQVDVRWEAMLPVLERRMPLVVRADTWQQIESAARFALAEGVRLVIVGGYDAPLCAELLKSAGAAVIVAGTHRLPLREDDAYDAPYTLPARLAQAGIPFCLASAGRAANVRNLANHAATAAAHGLERAAAVRAITLSAAEILGVADRLGSLAPGKEATLIVTDADVLDTTCHVTLAYIAGRPVDLSNRHTRLWDRYRRRYAPPAGARKTP
jgi:imidazolonepropionase-like amidohydrolase